jgi:hypothetical protein
MLKEEIIYRGFSLRKTKRGWSISMPGIYVGRIAPQFFKTKNAACRWINAKKSEENFRKRIGLYL